MKFSSLLLSVALLGLPLTLAAETKAAPHAVAAAPATAKHGATLPAGAHINVNTADAQGLSALKGIGPKKAEAIIAYRKTHGPFNSLEQFQSVPGIGPSIINKNRAVIVFR